MRTVSLVPLVFALGLWAAPAIAQSATGPRYLDSNPVPGEFLHKAPGEVSVAFSEPLGPGSTMAVSDACGRRADDGAVALQDNEMRVGLASSPAGDYTVSYVAQGSEDGSGAVPGSFGFEVHFGPDCDGSDKGGGAHNHHDQGDAGGTTRHGAAHDSKGSPAHGSGHPGAETHPAGTHVVAQHTSHPERHGNRHNKRRRHHHGSGRTVGGNNRDDLREDRPTAAGEVDAEATGADALLALALAASFGAVGGLILRASPER
jgi:methionine-rich copper-binding protein CopC